MHIDGLDHINIRTPDLDRLVHFYTKVLSFTVGERPPFDSPGVWLYAGGRPVVHVGVGQQAPLGDTQPLDHVAFNVSGLGSTLARLEEADVAFEIFDVPGRAMKQVFLTDPDGIKLELNYTDPEDVSASA